MTVVRKEGAAESHPSPQLLNSTSYSQYWGAAYGLAGLVKGLGIPTLKQFKVMQTLQDAIRDKKNVRHREGALFAFESLRDFRVRKSVVLCVLQWLLAINIYYHNVCIDPDALALLPEDGDMTGLYSTTLKSSDDDQDLSPPRDVNPYDAHLQECLSPVLPRDWQSKRPSNSL